MAAAAAIAGRFTDVRELGMRELRQVTGSAAVLDRADVDTDQIIPKQFLKRIERSGYGEFLFYDWMKDPDFELHRPEYAGRRDPRRRPQLRLRLLARARGLGARGLRLPRDPRAELQRHLPLERGQDRARAARAARGRSSTRSRRRSPQRNELTVDLEAREITHPDGLRIPIELDDYARETLIHGLDDVARTLRREERIAAYEATTPPRVDTTALAG